MPEERVQGVRIQETGQKKLDFDYQESDMESLYRRGKWHSWQDEISWLEQHGEEFKRFTPGETIAMVEDLRSMQASGAPFTNDPDQAYQMAHHYRAENNQKHAQEHARMAEQARRASGR